MWWGRYNKLVFEFKPFVDECGCVEKEIRDRVATMTHGRADIEFDSENGRLTVWGLRPSGGVTVNARLPKCVCYQFCDLTHEFEYMRKEMFEANKMSAVLETVKDTAPSKKNDVVVVIKAALIVLLTTAAIVGAIGIVRG